MNISRELDTLLKKVEKPARYIGGEINTVSKNPETVKVRFGFAFPDTYEIGMSYTGLQLLYNILNKDEDIYCERVFAPAMDMEEAMKASGMELFTLETKTPVKEMDFLGFTLQYEMSYTNIINMLKLGGIAPLSGTDAFHPGGPAAAERVPGGGDPAVPDLVHITLNRWRIS